MSLLDDGFELLTERQTDFVDGLPSWLTEDTSGSGSVTTSSGGGGRVDLSVGTAATGDYAGVQTPTLVDGARPDIIEIKTAIYHDGNAASSGSCDTEVGFKEEGGAVDAGNFHRINDSDSGDRNTIAGAETADTLIDFEYVPTQVIFDNENEVVYHRTQGAYRQQVEKTKYGSYHGRVRITQRDTSSSRKIQLNRFAVRMWDRL